MSIWNRPIEPKAWVTRAARWWLGPEPETPHEQHQIEQPEPEPAPESPMPEPEGIEPRKLSCQHGDHCLSLGSHAAFRIYADGCVECVPCADQHTEGHRR